MNGSDSLRSVFLSYLPLDIVIMCITYCDYGDPDDKNIFLDIAESIKQWKTELQFKSEDFRLNRYNCRKTSIVTTGGEHYYHSIDDEPSLIITNEELTKLPDVNNIPTDNVDPPFLMMFWTRIGVIHRKNNFAILDVNNSSNITYNRYWIENGITRHHGLGHANEFIYYTLSGSIQIIKWWMKSCKAELMPLHVLMSKIQKSESVFDIYSSIHSLYKFDNMIIHRVDGPGGMIECLDIENKSKQIKEAKDNEYDEAYGPFPRECWYINGISVSSMEHQQIIKKLDELGISPEEYSGNV